MEPPRKTLDGAEPGPSKDVNDVKTSDTKVDLDKGKAESGLKQNSSQKRPSPEPDVERTPETQVGYFF